MSSIVAASDSGKYAPMSENDKKLIDMIIKVNCQVHPSLATQYDRDEDDNPIIESVRDIISLNVFALDASWEQF